jgi:cytoskeleton protein RodZ
MFEIGSSLRDARVRQGLDVTELEAETKIRAKYLRALEEERFDLLPGDAYAKGFLRTYAERLGLDGQLYVDEFNSRFSLAEEPVVSSRPQRQQRQSRLEANAVLIALAGIVAVTVLVIAAWRLGGDGGDEPSTTPADPATTSSAAPPAAFPSSTGAETVAVVEPVDLVVTARRGSSAVEARRGSPAGELLFDGRIARGETMRFTGKQLWLRLGKVQNLELTLNGAQVEGEAAVGSAAIVVTADGVRLAEGD